MKFAEQSCIEFIERLSSKDSMPGGGAATALVGALGVALAGMVTSLTRGKKNFIK
ncbi:MAG: cyclodeaminase/cyclohydrolase family protein, partial [Clostridioides sp.]|nr:cyclodeaminase/cyclohydrolase family protein [Clostridioides sp.]